MDSTRLEQDALKQLAAVPGVVGSLVFDRSGAVVASAFPPIVEAGLHQLTAQLSADGFFQEWLTGDEAALQLLYADGRVAFRPLDGSWLLVLCTAEANAQLLSMSLTQVVRRLRGQLRERVAAAPAPPPSPLEQLRGIVSAELGDHAARALEILAAAGSRPKDLLRATSDVEKMTRLFISKTKAEEIGATMREVLEGATRAKGST